MIEGEASRTAYGAAMLRALHQETESPVFVDPLAWRILGDREELLTTAAEWDRPTMGTFIAVRHRFADDALATAVQRGTGQVVVLGAGLDTIAYRNPWPEVAVFEVDHPDTGRWKRSMVAAAGLSEDKVTYVGVDFETDSFLASLAAAGFHVDEPTFFVWLGVTPYLTHDAVRATLAAIASVPGSEVVFEHMTPVAGVEDAGHADRASLAAEVAGVGEPLVGSWSPESMAALLGELGFDDVEVLGRGEIRVRYLGKPAGEPRPGGVRLVRARRTGG